MIYVVKVEVEMLHFELSKQACLDVVGFCCMNLIPVAHFFNRILRELTITITTMLHAFLSRYRLLHSKSITHSGCASQPGVIQAHVLPLFCIDSVLASHNSQTPSCSLDSWSCACIALSDPETST